MLSQRVILYFPSLSLPPNLVPIRLCYSYPMRRAFNAEVAHRKRQHEKLAKKLRSRSGERDKKEKEQEQEEKWLQEEDATLEHTH